MTPLEAIEQANEDADVRSFRFANLSEFNKFIESFEFEDYPCHVLAPFEISQEWTGGRVQQTIPLQGWVLRRIDQDTVNFRTMEIEEDFIQPMRTLAKKIIRGIVDSDITDPEVDPITSNIKPEYGLLSARVFGVSYTMQWPVLASVC